MSEHRTPGVQRLLDMGRLREQPTLHAALGWMRRTLPAIHLALQKADPSLAGLLVSPTVRGER